MLEEAIKDRRAEHRSRTRAEIIEAAWTLARAHGLASITLRDIGRLVGMQAPSLYSYFESKHAIYDAMFAHGWREYVDGLAQLEFTGDPLTDIKIGMRHFVEFAVTDPVRYQLLVQRPIPGFEPSAESFATAMESLEGLRSQLATFGITDPTALDLLTAIGTGLTSQQISNDPGGDRWVRLVDEAMEMFYAHVSRKESSDA
jgi:AcrR family transcriptional regulator